MTSPMANSQMLTSNRPRSGARNFMPRDTKMVRMVEIVTTHTSAIKIYTGSELLEPNTDRPPLALRRTISIKKRPPRRKSKKAFSACESRRRRILSR